MFKTAIKEKDTPNKPQAVDRRKKYLSEGKQTLFTELSAPVHRRPRDRPAAPCEVWERQHSRHSVRSGSVPPIGLTCFIPLENLVFIVEIKLNK